MTIDLSTRYGSLELKSPVIVGACPLTAEELMRIALASAGVGAMVLPSLFEEQVTLWNERNGYMSVPLTERNQHNQHVLERAIRMRVDTVCEDADSYLSLVERASSMMGVPIIASLNGECDGNWENFAVKLESAGANGIELHVRQPPPSRYDDPREIEDAIVETAARISNAISIPLFLKLGRNYTSLSLFSERLLPVAQGLVLFGQTPRVDIDLDNLHLTYNWGLSEIGSIARSLETIIRVRDHRPEMSLAASGGIGSSADLIKVLLAGANAAMITSAVYRDGPTVVGTLLEGLLNFMERHHLKSIRDLRTCRPLAFDSDEERIDYIKAVSAKTQPAMVRDSNCMIESDRWGHPRSPR